MDDKPDTNCVTNPAAPGVSPEAQELIRDWEFRFFAFLLFGLGRLAWLYLYRPSTPRSISVWRVALCSAAYWGFLMRWVLSPKRQR